MFQPLLVTFLRRTKNSHLEHVFTVAMFQMGLCFYMEIDTCHKSRVAAPKNHVNVLVPFDAKGPYSEFL
jgi:hypothetical protein